MPVLPEYRDQLRHPQAIIREGDLMPRYQAYAIKYETDRQTVDLPKTVDFKAADIDEALEVAADKVSDATGFLVKSLRVRAFDPKAEVKRKQG